jgi:hypothetical protein
MLSLLKGFPIVATIKAVVATGLIAFIISVYLNHQALKAKVLSQKAAITSYQSAQKQSKQVNNQNKLTIKQLEKQILTQQNRQARHEKALLLAQANQNETTRELNILRANNETVKTWLDTSHNDAISRLLNNARARYTNDSQNKNNQVNAAGALLNPR